MCLLIIGLHQVPDLPVVLAANRDEFYDRAAEPPTLLRDHPRIVAGRDVRAGGTWLGVNEHGVIAALTNRHVAAPEQPGLPSRGTLCLSALACETAGAAARFASELTTAEPHNPFNLLTVDRNCAWLVSNVDVDAPVELPPGWHVIANQAVNDADDPRVIRAIALLERVHKASREHLIARLADVCKDHGAGTGSDLCIHGEKAGTRSSSILTVAETGLVTYLHADGPPCKTPYWPVRLAWQEQDF